MDMPVRLPVPIRRPVRVASGECSVRAADVHENLAILSRELASLLMDYEAANFARAEAEMAWKSANADAYLKAEGNLETRKQTAILATAELAREAELAAVVFDNTRTALRVLAQRLDAGRTIASTIRAEAIATGVGV